MKQQDTVQLQHSFETPDKLDKLVMDMGEDMTAIIMILYGKIS